MANLGYIQVTRECNQRCRFCSNPPSGRSATLEALEAQAAGLVAEGCSGIILTGGEPTLRPDLPALVERVKRLGVPVRIITNGQRLAEGPLLHELADAGLDHLHLSMYSHREAVQDHLTRNPGGYQRLMASFERLRVRREAGLLPTVDLNVVINHENAAHLHELAAFVVEQLPFIHHVVWNNLDPSTDRIAEAPELVPTLWEMEVPLARALALLHRAGRTFRVERVPLCYLPGFEHVSTETRKIVKEEPRLIHFLDDKALVRQETRLAWQRGKAEACRSCRLDPLCAGLDSMDVHYDSAELSPVFVDPALIVDEILGEDRG